MELTIEQALQQAVTAHKEGKQQHAERLYRAILKSQPAHPDANHNLGLIAVSLNKAEAALPFFKTALDANPKIEQFWLSYIDALIKELQFDNAKQALKQAKKQGLNGDRLKSLETRLTSINEKVRVANESPSQEQIRNLFKHYQNGKYDDAEKLALYLSVQFPRHNLSWKILAAVLKKTARASEAVYAGERAIEIAPDDAEAHYNLANTLKELGRLDNAEASYVQALALKPDYAEAHINLGAMLQELGKLAEAEARYSQALVLEPSFYQIYNNLGSALKELGRLEEAEASYHQAITLKPSDPEAYLNLCELLENMNRTEELFSLIKSEAINIAEKKADFFYFEALMEFRGENYELAAKLIEKINISELFDRRKPSALKLKGDISHHRTNYGAAFEAYKLKNKHVKDSVEYKKQEPEKYFIQQREKVAQLSQLQQKSAYKSAIKPSWIQPTFLIGFPRSGTTLLDTILRTHSKIDVLEELPMLDKMNASLGGTSTISAIEAIDNTAANIASGIYFDELKQHLEISKKRILIDKLPLNILHVPLINQVFPYSKYIIALRHPLDCVLSCWMQNFKLNPPMANMTELERIADFYDVAMSILKLSEERYSLHTHRIRYEDLVLDFKQSVTKILTFLDLKWEEGLRSYQKTALARDRIKTPSSSQVIKPLYQTASYRWKNYEEYLGQCKTRLATWMHEYGY